MKKLRSEKLRADFSFPKVRLRQIIFLVILWGVLSRRAFLLGFPVQDFKLNKSHALTTHLVNLPVLPRVCTLSLLDREWVPGLDGRKRAF